MIDVLDKENNAKYAVCKYEYGRVDDYSILLEEYLSDGVYKYTPCHISMKKSLSVVNIICVLFTFGC